MMTRTSRTSLLSVAILALLTACGGGGGGGGGGGTGPVVPPSTNLDPSPANAGIIAMAAGDGILRIDCVLPGSGHEAALFTGGSRSTLYQGTPTPVTTSSFTVTGLANGIELFAGLAIRVQGTTAWTPAGVPVRFRPGAPLFVDARNSGSMDGLTPATAFSSLTFALFVAGATPGGRNVWVRDGNYLVGGYPIGPGTHLYGGFSGALGTPYDLGSRNATGGLTLLTGLGGLNVVDVICGGEDAVLDGIKVDCRNGVTEGIDITDSDVEIRSVQVQDATDRGLRMRTLVFTNTRDLVMVNCVSTSNGSDGISVDGVVETVLDRCFFDANGRDGLDAEVFALGASERGFRVRTSRFFGNVGDGFNLELASAPTATVGYRVDIEGSLFERNGIDGMVIDQDHELDAALSSAIVVRGSTARANREAGFQLDADARGTYLLHRVSGTANAGDGLLVTSESDAGEVVVGASWFAANLGHGVRTIGTGGGGTLGNKAVHLSHCAVAGNAAGGFLAASARGSSASGGIWKQLTAFSGVLQQSNWTGDADAAQPFVVAPKRFLRATANQSGAITVNSTSGVAAGDAAEVGDNGIALTVTSASGTSLIVTPAPTAFVSPDAVTVHSDPAAVVDNLAPRAGSGLIGAGMSAQGGPAVDAGPFGAPAGGAPGSASPLDPAVGLRLLRTVPATATGVTGSSLIRLEFDRQVAGASVTQQRVVVIDESTGNAVTASIAVSGNAITLNPTGGGWPLSFFVRILPGISATDGSALGLPLALPFRTN